MIPKTINFSQKTPISIDKAWNFFSSPHNLSKITPKEMQFSIKSHLTVDQKIYPGMLIAYTLKPLPGIKMNWITEITHIKEGEYFIDEQRLGPYSFWQHQHHFEIIDGGVEIIDRLTYAVPFGFIGSLANRIFVEKEIFKIFEFRKQKIEELFGNYPA